MMNVAKELSSFTLASVKGLRQEQAMLYEADNTVNNAAACKSLLALVSAILSSQIIEWLEANATFPDVWLHFIKSIHTH
jgi:hypothetical protein